MDEDEEVNRWIEAQYAIEQALEQDAQKLVATGTDPMSGRSLGEAQIQSEGKPVSLDGILKERNATHGDYLIQSSVCQELKRLIREGPSWYFMEDNHKDALEMICMKMSRIVTGDHTHKDSWVDIAGYATLISNTLGVKG